MNKQKQQQGSAHTIIIIIFVVALLGALGFVFWQNFINRSSNTTQNNTSQDDPVPAVKLKTAQIDDQFPVKLSWDYPESWTIKTEGEGPKNATDTATQTITLTSPSKDYEVVYKVGANGGLGGSCIPDDSGTLQYVHREPLANFSKGVFVEFITDTSSIINSQKKLEGYRYVSSIYGNEDRINNAKEGDSFCSVYLGGVIELSKVSNTVLLGADIKLKKIDMLDQYGDVQAIKDIGIIQSAYGAKEYKDAVAILKSTRLK